MSENENLKLPTSLKVYGYVSILVALALTIFGAVAAAKSLTMDQLGGAKLGTVFMMLIFVALIIERAVEVFVTNSYAIEELDITRATRLKRRELEAENSALQAKMEMVIPEANEAVKAARIEMLQEQQELVSTKREELNKLLNDNADKLDGFAMRKAAFAAMLTTAFGAFAALAGVRTLEQFVDPGQIGKLPVTSESATSMVTDPLIIEGTWQALVFTGTDIFLTAMLLAGGADGIHKVVKAFLPTRKSMLEIK
ncbi:MAG: hypothetical protein ACPGGK_12200 [Pikeienuella sp.]